MAILVVDDSTGACQALKAILESDGFDSVQTAFSTSEAFELLGLAAGLNTATAPDAILLDICIPPVDGVRACGIIKSHSEFHDVPIIMMTGWDSAGQLQAAFEAGAADYLTKPIDPPELLARLHAAINVTRELRRRTERIDRLLEGQKKATTEIEELRGLASQDEVTGTATRRLFNDVLQLEWSRGLRDGAPLGLLMIDVDHFKAYNDTYGHPLGDLCLHQVADALRSALRRPADLLARYGGEEFAVLLPGTPLEGVASVAEAMARRLADAAMPHAFSSTGFVTVCMGAAALIPTAALRSDELVQSADSALYAAKRGGRNRIVEAQERPPAVHAHLDGDTRRSDRRSVDRVASDVS